MVAYILQWEGVPNTYIKYDMILPVRESYILASYFEGQVAGSDFKCVTDFVDRSPASS